MTTLKPHRSLDAFQLPSRRIFRRNFGDDIRSLRVAADPDSLGCRAVHGHGIGNGKAVLGRVVARRMIRRAPTVRCSSTPWTAWRISFERVGRVCVSFVEQEGRAAIGITNARRNVVTDLLDYSRLCHRW